MEVGGLYYFTSLMHIRLTYFIPPQSLSILCTVCVKDCTDSADKACDNSLKDSSMVLYDTAADCCSNKLGWIPNTQCADLSTTGAAAVKTGPSKSIRSTGGALTG